MASQNAVIILNYNGLKDTKDCLNSIDPQDLNHSNTMIYLVDNASTQGNPSQLTKLFPFIHLIQNQKNLGFAGGNNVGIRQALTAGASIITLLNNDTTLPPNFFTDLASAFKRSGFALASPKIYFYPGREFHRQSYSKSERGKIIWYAGGFIDWDNVIPSHIGVNEFDHGQFDQPEPTDFATGCCLIAQAQVFSRIGLLDESYRMYFEDTDFSLRASRAGLSVGYLPQPFLWHKNASSTGGSGSSTQAALVNRSRLKFGLKYAPLRAKLALVKSHFFSPMV